MKYFSGCLALILWASPVLAQTPVATPVNLTITQKTQIDQIRQDSRQRIQTLFSSAQRKTYAGLRQRGVSASQAIEMIDLNQSSREELRRVLRESGAAIVKVLGRP
jgi:hypothetical protein